MGGETQSYTHTGVALQLVVQNRTIWGFFGFSAEGGNKTLRQISILFPTSPPSLILKT